MNLKRILSLLLALIMTLALCVSVIADERGTTYEDFRPRALRDGETLLRGIDVSQFQGDIDWKAVADKKTTGPRYTSAHTTNTNTTSRRTGSAVFSVWKANRIT